VIRLSTDERRALGLIAALLVLAAAARWIERPRPIAADLVPLDLAALEQQSRDAKPGDRPAVGSPGGPATLDPNTATPAELTALPGVGPALAARIAAARDTLPFRSAADLERVRGIGPALTARLTPLVSLPAHHPAVEPSPTAHVDPRPEGGRAGPRTKDSAPSASSAVKMIPLNLAPASDLERIPGIGPVLAARLIAYRDSLGPFPDWEAVDAVPGVGPALLARLRQRAVLQRHP
jgi:competence protein ComEA